MDNTSTLILTISLIITMWGMGLTLIPADFKRVMQSPKAVLLGLVNQLLLLPLIGFGILQVIPSSPEVAIGIMILASAPGGPTSNLLSMLAKADTALSVTLTAINSVITVFTIPFVVNFGLEQFAGQGQTIRLDIVQTILTMMVVVILPMIIGMIVKAQKETFADRMAKPVRVLSVILLATIIVGIVLKEKDNIVTYFASAGLVALSLNICTMAVGFFTSRMFKLSRAQSLTVSLESGMQNGTLALTIAGALLMNTSYTIAPAVYSLIMYFTSGALIAYFLRSNAATSSK